MARDDDFDLTTEQAAAIIGCTTRYPETWAAAGLLPAKRGGDGRFWFRRKDVERWARRHPSDHGAPIAWPAPGAGPERMTLVEAADYLKVPVTDVAERAVTGELESHRDRWGELYFTRPGLNRFKAKHPGGFKEYVGEAEAVRRGKLTAALLKALVADGTISTRKVDGRLEYRRRDIDAYRSSIKKAVKKVESQVRRGII